jgi:hypothetical protein
MIESLQEAPLIALETDLTPQSLVSGLQTLSGQDPSVLPTWNRKVVAISDFTTLLSKDKIFTDALFGILRSAYDGRYYKKFGNTVIRKYESRFGMLCGVTPIIEKETAKNPVVGERFLKFYVHTENRLRQGTLAINQALDNTDFETGMREDLRKISTQALDRPVTEKDRPTASKGIKTRIALLAQWTAAVRGAVTRDKYTRDVEHMPVTEIGTRLAKQLFKLARGVAIFRRKKAVGYDELRIAARVARFSAPDRVQELIHHLYVFSKDHWVKTEELAARSVLPRQTIDRILQDMLMLKLVRTRKRGVERTYRLSATLAQMMQPLDLYERETRWTRAKAPPKPEKAKKQKKVKRVRKVKKT